MKRTNLLTEYLKIEKKEIPLNYSFIKECEKTERDTIKIDLYDTDNYFDLRNFYKPICNI